MHFATSHVYIIMSAIICQYSCVHKIVVFIVYTFINVRKTQYKKLRMQNYVCETMYTEQCPSYEIIRNYKNVRFSGHPLIEMSAI